MFSGFLTSTADGGFFLKNVPLKQYFLVPEEQEELLFKMTLCPRHCCVLPASRKCQWRAPRLNLLNLKDMRN